MAQQAIGNMMITGKMLIGQSAVRGDNGSLCAINPATHETLSPDFGVGGMTDIELACTLAQQAFDRYRATTAEQRAQFLEAIANGRLSRSGQKLLVLPRTASRTWPFSYSASSTCSVRCANIVCKPGMLLAISIRA